MNQLHDCGGNRYWVPPDIDENKGIRDMKLGLLGGYGGKMIRVDIDRIKYAESLGYDSIWTAELMVPMQ